MQEVWHPIPQWEGFYEVSSDGRVRSIDRIIPHPKRGVIPRKGRILKPWINSRGYRTIRLSRFICVPGAGVYARQYPVHALVALAFIGPRPKGKNIHILHGAGGKLDNCLTNIRYGTAAENEKDKIRDGTSNRGTRNRTARLTENQVLSIRARVDNGESPVSVAKEYNVSKSTIYCIKARRTWGWLDAI